MVYNIERTRREVILRSKLASKGLNGERESGVQGVQRESGAQEVQVNGDDKAQSSTTIASSRSNEDNRGSKEEKGDREKEYRDTDRDTDRGDKSDAIIKSMLIKLINYEARLAKVEKELVAVLEREESLTIALREAVEHIQSVTTVDEHIQSVTTVDGTASSCKTP